MALVGGVVVTHGRLAIELLAAAETIVGEIHHITAVSIGWHDDADLACKEIEKAIARVNNGAGVLLLTDMFGGTPTNLSMTFSQPEKVEIITGVNLPMIIRLANQRQNEPLTEVASKVRDQGQKNIYLASEVLSPKRQ
ncbi:MAG: PTS sugar transporter subunit IIA [Blastocatellia bacterium]|nr:PTS sugar transporter subunit IIA [Blastocatellia bacterium]